MGSRGASSGNNNVSFTKMMGYSVDAALSAGKILTVIEEGKKVNKTFNTKHSKTSEALKGYKTVRLKVYRDKSGSNTLKRVQDSGFKISKVFKGKSSGSIPAEDYYYMKRS